MRTVIQVSIESNNFKVARKKMNSWKANKRNPSGMWSRIKRGNSRNVLFTVSACESTRYAFIMMSVVQRTASCDHSMQWKGKFLVFVGREMTHASPNAAAGARCMIGMSDSVVWRLTAPRRVAFCEQSHMTTVSKHPSLTGPRNLVLLPAAVSTASYDTRFYFSALAHESI